MKEFTKEQSNIAKGLGIFGLLLYHLFNDPGIVDKMGVNYAPLSDGVFETLAAFGNVCVSVFVMITAYGITKSIKAKGEISIKSAYEGSLKRFLTLMKNFAILYLSVWVVWGFWLFDYSSLYGEGKQSVLFLISDGLGLSEIFATPMMNSTWWYMALAYTLIFLVPLIAFLVSKIGCAVIPMAVLLPFTVSIHEDIANYLFVATIGVVMAYYGLFDKAMNSRVKLPIKWVIAVLGLTLSIIIRPNAVVDGFFFPYFEAAAAIFVIYFATFVIGAIPGLRAFVSFVGRHSLNIFLVHTFFYLILWMEFVYKFKYAIVTFTILLVMSLLYSIILEFIKNAAKKGLSKIKVKIGKKP